MNQTQVLLGVIFAYTMIIVTILYLIYFIIKSVKSNKKNVVIEKQENADSGNMTISIKDKNIPTGAETDIDKIVLTTDTNFKPEKSIKPDIPDNIKSQPADNPLVDEKYTLPRYSRN